MITTSASRVSGKTDPCVNERIRRRTEKSLAHFQSHPEGIPRRLGELDREWDVERVLETGSAALTLAGVTLGLTRNRKWFAFALAAQGIFLHHALKGGGPPLPILRRLGVRTQYEIEQERYALKALRGDYRNVEAGKVENRSPEDVIRGLMQ